MLNKIFNKITKDIILYENQGYACYLKINDEELIKTKGLKDIEKNDLIDEDTFFRLASVSKQFIAYGIVDLVINNKLSYDTTIKTIYNDLPDYFNNITIKNLLNHTSGLLNYEDIPHRDNDAPILDHEVLEYLKTTTNTYFEPGSMYKYSNTAYVLLACIIETISQKPIEVYLKETIFDKANMPYSTANHEGITKIKNRAYGHILQDNKMIKKDQSWTSYTIGDGGIYSSINELKNWIKFLSKSTHSKDMFTSNILSDNTDTEYGLGIRPIKINNQDFLYHSGNTIGTNTLLFFSKDLKIQLIFLTNFGYINTTELKTNFVNLLKERKGNDIY